MELTLEGILSPALVKVYSWNNSPFVEILCHWKTVWLSAFVETFQERVPHCYSQQSFNCACVKYFQRMKYPVGELKNDFVNDGNSSTPQRNSFLCKPSW